MKVEGKLISCSRTDKEASTQKILLFLIGQVHALSNVASFFSSVDETKINEPKELIAEINKSLGKENKTRVFSLRVLGLKEVTFNNSRKRRSI